MIPHLRRAVSPYDFTSSISVMPPPPGHPEILDPDAPMTAAERLL
ncbi:DUF6059 family protein [Streptomyces sp. JV176]